MRENRGLSGHCTKFNKAYRDWGDGARPRSWRSVLQIRSYRHGALGGRTSVILGSEVAKSLKETEVGTYSGQRLKNQGHQCGRRWNLSRLSAWDTGLPRYKWRRCRALERGVIRRSLRTNATKIEKVEVVSTERSEPIQKG